LSEFDPYQTPPSALDETAASSLGREPLAGLGAPASRLSRLIASIIDGIALSLIFVVLALVHAVAIGSFDWFLEEDINFLEDSILTVIAGLIFVRLNTRLIVRKGQTIGKKLLAIQVVGVEDNLPLPFWDFVLRRYSILLLLPAIPVVGVFLSMGETLFIFRADRRCLHDLVAGTKVVNAQPNK